MNDYTPKSRGVKIYAGGRRVGVVRGDTFFKRICHRHILFTPPAIAVDIEALNQAEKVGASRADVLDLDSGTHYLASIAHFWKTGFLFNRGFGDQLGLPLENWQVVQKGRVYAEQLSIWGCND